MSDRNLETLLPRSNQHVSRIRSIPIPVFDIACKPPEEDYAHAQAEVDDHEHTVIGSEGIRNSNVQKIQHVNWDQHSQMGIGLGMLPGNHCKDWTSLQYNNETNLLGNNMLHEAAHKQDSDAETLAGSHLQAVSLTLHCHLLTASKNCLRLEGDHLTLKL